MAATYTHAQTGPAARSANIGRSEAKKILSDDGIGSRARRRRSPRDRLPSVASLDNLFKTGHESESSDPKRHPLDLEDREALNTYGVTEMRDSFFDAVFYPPEEVDIDDLMWHAKLTLPYAFRKQDPLSLTNFFPKQWHEVKSVLSRVTKTRAGIKLLKSSLGFFVAYILCLIPSVRNWLGTHNYIMAISTLLNHSGRTVGAQVEGTILTIIGTASGLGWGAFGLWLSTVSVNARVGFGDAGARPLAVSLHNAFSVMVTATTKTPMDRLARRRLAQCFVNLSQTYRDLVLDFSITLFDPKDVLQLRNLMQGVIRALLSLKSDTRLFDIFEQTSSIPSEDLQARVEDFVVDFERDRANISAHEVELLRFVAENLIEPTESLFAGMRVTLQRCDAVLMDMCGHRQYLGPPRNISDDVAGSLVKLRRRIITFMTTQDSVLASEKLPPAYAEYPEIVKLFAYCRPVHQAATAVEALAVKVNQNI
ncbi:hypothetical protein TruAng_009342 [Truncatella angustata]|nr:hypothetical protein TruAng_009342 [Truncatella angustata]